MANRKVIRMWDIDELRKLKALSGSWCRTWLSVAGWKEEAANGLSQLSSRTSLHPLFSAYKQYTN